MGITNGFQPSLCMSIFGHIAHLCDIISVDDFVQ